MTIVHCPRCRDEVTVPAKASPKALVRCPLCLEEYLLSEALAEMPPTLLVVGGEMEEEEALVGAGVAEAEFGGGEYRMAGSSFGGALDSSAPAGAAVATTRPGVKGTARAKRKERSALGEMLKIAMGGVIGLSLGLMVLWWGLRKDPLKLGPQVSPYVPWIVPAEFQHKAGSSGATAQNTIAPGNTSAQGNVSGSSTSLNTPTGSDGSFQAHPSSQATTNSSSPPAGDPLQTLPDASGFGGAASEPVVPASVDLPSFDPLPTTPEANPASAPTEEPAATENENNPKSKGARSLPASEPPAVDLTDLLPGGTPPTTTEENPKPETKPEPSPENAAPAVSPADLATAVTTAGDALVRVEESKGESKEVRQQLFTDLYLAVAEGGRVLSHLDPAGAEVAEPLASLKELLAGLAGQTGKLSAFGHLGRTHLPLRKAGEGFAFTGTVVDFKSAGGVFETTLDAGSNVTIQLISTGNPQDFCQPGDQLLAIGRIVDEPQKNIAGYEGEAERVVLLGEAAKAPPAE